MRSTTTYFRNFIFGVEDSLVSTVGLLSGIAIAGVETKTVLLTGVVLIFVEAISMAAGSFLSEAEAEDLENSKHSLSIASGAVMFASYFVAGFVPLAPYVFADADSAFWYSITVSVCALFLLGAWSGRLSRKGILRSAIRMALVGGAAIGVGVTVGSFLS